MNDINIYYDDQEIQVYQGEELVIFVDKHSEKESLAYEIQGLLTDFGIVANIHEGIVDDEYEVNDDNQIR